MKYHFIFVFAYEQKVYFQTAMLEGMSTTLHPHHEAGYC